MIPSDSLSGSTKESARSLRRALDDVVRPLRLGFEPVLEAEFETATRPRRLQAMRRFLLVVAVIVVACILLDAHAGEFRLGVAVRLLFQVPSLLLAAFLLGKRTRVRVQSIAFGAAVVAVVAGTAAIGTAADAFDRSRYLMAAALFMYTVNVGMPIGFRLARAISLASLFACTAIVVNGALNVPEGSNADILAFTAIVVFASLLITYRAEIAQREAFLIGLRERFSSQDLQLANQQLLMLSQTDALTNVFNRRFFDRAGPAARAESLRDGTWLALMMIDVDYFKRINDSLGHSEGDACLQKIARTIRDHVRAEDLVSRYGGEEFVVILPAATPVEAMFVAERVRLAVESLQFEDPARETFVTVSIGVAAFSAKAEATIVDFVKSADKALYAAKTAGRNRVSNASELDAA